MCCTSATAALANAELPTPHKKRPFQVELMSTKKGLSLRLFSFPCVIPAYAELCMMPTNLTINI